VLLDFAVVNVVERCEAFSAKRFPQADMPILDDTEEVPVTRGSSWREFFDGHAPLYMGNTFTRNTTAEVDFLLEELELARGSQILDIGCGTGRHSVELAKRGYQVVGLDLSAGMLAEAQKAAAEAAVEVQWIHGDATRFVLRDVFDATICLCEGAFSLLDTDDDPMEHDLAILRNIHSALKSEGSFVLTTLNGYAKIRQFTQEDVESGRFDPLTLIETYTMEYDSPAGKKKTLVRERGYLPQELRDLFEQAGFHIDHIWGGTAGNWGRRRINLDEIEIMVVAKRR